MIHLRVGVARMGIVCILMCLIEELAWATNGLLVRTKEQSHFKFKSINTVCVVLVTCGILITLSKVL